MRNIFVVHGNEDYSGYGNQHYIYGVFDDEQAAKITQKKMKKKLYTKVKKNEDTEMEIKSADEIDIQILEIPKNRIIEEYLGGYTE